MKKNWPLHAYAIFSTLAFLALQLYDPTYIREKLETLFYDLRLAIKSNVLSEPQPADILIVTVDERSIAELGRWPWSRKLQAEVVRKISAGQPRVLGIDIMYTEAESPQADKALAEAIEEAGNVVLATPFVAHQSEGLGVHDPEYLWDHAFMSVKSTEDLPWKQWIFKPYTVLPPIEALATVAHLGSVFSPPDADGKLRWEILYIYYGEDYYPSLSLQVARIYLGLEMKEMELLGGRGVMLGDRLISTDISGRVLIHYLGGAGFFRYVSAADVLSGKVPPSAFKDKAVLLGTSALATYDEKATPLATSSPGVEKNATVLENILHDRHLKKSPGLVEMFITLVTGLVLTVLLTRMRAARGAVLATSLMAAYLAVAGYVFVYYSLWLNVVYPVGNMLSIFGVQVTARYLMEERKAKQMRAMFSSYVSPQIVQALIDNPEMAKLGGQRKVVTVLFSDIAGFTSMSENRSPEEVVSLLNEYFKEMTDVIFRWQGTFDKIVGDEIMAFWGAPVEQPNHAELAVRCALDMLGQLRKLQRKWAAEGKPIIDIGIGLNSGEVVVGNIGAEDKKMDYTIIGDNVNAGARVEALTRQFKAKMLITGATAEYIKPLMEAGKFGHVKMESRGEAKVKGKEQGLQIYELIEMEQEGE